MCCYSLPQTWPLQRPKWECYSTHFLWQMFPVMRFTSPNVYSVSVKRSLLTSQWSIVVMFHCIEWSCPWHCELSQDPRLLDCDPIIWFVFMRNPLAVFSFLDLAIVLCFLSFNSSWFTGVSKRILNPGPVKQSSGSSLVINLRKMFARLSAA